MRGRVVESVRDDDADRYAVVVLAGCSGCGGSGRVDGAPVALGAGTVLVVPRLRCPSCAGRGDVRERVAYTSRDGIGLALVTLRDEGELDGAVGVLDRRARRWVVNPYAARGRSPAPSRPAG